MDYTAVSMAIKRFEQRMSKEKELRVMKNRAMKNLE
jgi:hypothetical protein